MVKSRQRIERNLSHEKTEVMGDRELALFLMDGLRSLDQKESLKR